MASRSFKAFDRGSPRLVVICMWRIADKYDLTEERHSLWASSAMNKTIVILLLAKVWNSMISVRRTVSIALSRGVRSPRTICQTIVDQFCSQPLQVGDCQLGWLLPRNWNSLIWGTGEATLSAWGAYANRIEELFCKPWVCQAWFDALSFPGHADSLCFGQANKSSLHPGILLCSISSISAALSDMISIRIFFRLFFWPIAQVATLFSALLLWLVDGYHC